MKIHFLFFYIILFWGIVFITSCHSNNDEKPIAQLPVEVNVLTIGSNNTSSSSQINYSSTIEADKTIDISPLISGTILSIPVEIGQYVQKGQLIATIDETIYRSQYNAQMAQVNLAKETYDRMLTVYNKGSIAEIRMLNAKADYEQASATAKATYQNIARCKIYAPQSGFVGKKNVEAGATASPGVALVQLYDVNTVSANVPVPENEINKYKKGFDAFVNVPAINNRTFEGKVDKISVTPSAGAPIYTVQIKVNNTEHLLKPGMTCNVLFNASNNKKYDSSNIVIVPVEAVQVDEQKQNFIFLADPSIKKAVRKNVEVGDLYETGISIKSGLKSGDQLIISGFHKITDGSSIRIINN
ncbi:MAG: efflux RND transporter periplasmic adaptor subunit [Arachidicoccus sp.]|nr:efflux RND transporter periplasmic adaptor subunit [Arachidicoccus sp.]